MREPRLGDDIDDYCVRCKRVMNHSIVSVISGEPAKVRCRTCHSDHDFRREQPPPPKVDLRKQAAFNEVLKKVDPSAEEVAVDDPPEEAIAEAAGEDVAPEKEIAAHAPKKARAKARKSEHQLAAIHLHLLVLCCPGLGVSFVVVARRASTCRLR